MSQMSSTASHIHRQDLPHQLRVMEGDPSQCSSRAHTNPPNTMGRCKGSQEKVKHSPSTNSRLCMSHSCDPTATSTGKTVPFRQVIFKNEKGWVDGKEDERFLSLAEKNRQIEDQIRRAWPLSRSTQRCPGPNPVSTEESRAWIQMFMSPRIKFSEYTPIPRQPATVTAAVPLVCGLLIHWFIWSAWWKCLWWFQFGSPSSTKRFTGRFHFRRCRYPKSAEGCIVQEKCMNCCHLK